MDSDIRFVELTGTEALEVVGGQIAAGGCVVNPFGRMSANEAAAIGAL